MILKTYQVNWSWDQDTDYWLRQQTKGFTLNICCGTSRVGNIRADLDRSVRPDVICSVEYPPFKNGSFDTVVCDPPFSMFNRFRWVIDLAELAKKRYIVSHGSHCIRLKRVWRKTIYATEVDGASAFLRLWSFFDKIELASYDDKTISKV